MLPKDKVAGPTLALMLIAVAAMGGYFIGKTEGMKVAATPNDLAVTLRHIELAERFEKALPPELLARIKASQARIDPTCSTQFNVTDIPASFSVIYQKAERDSAGMLTSVCEYRPETKETFYAGVHYPDPR